MSAPWNPAILQAPAGVKEVDVTAMDPDDTRRASRTLWSIGVGDKLFVRSWKVRRAV